MASVTGRLWLRAMRLGWVDVGNMSLLLEQSLGGRLAAAEDG
jgi:hypothetical protein